MKLLPAATAIFMLLPWTAGGFARGSLTDEEAVAGAQVIVIASLKENSLQMPSLEERRKDSNVMLKGVTATLVVKEVLKGPFLVSELPVLIEYGLTPKSVAEAMLLPNALTREDIEIGWIKIFDTGNSRMSLAPVTGDIKQDQIWLLHIRGGSPAGIAKLSIYNPEDVQPLSKKASIMTLVAKGKDAAEAQEQKHSK